MHCLFSLCVIQLNWSHLRHEFPVLNPAQLYYVVNQYMLPPKMVNALRHWTPSKEDATLAFTSGKRAACSWVSVVQQCSSTMYVCYNPGNVQESFDSHPRFAIPSTGYTLDLSKPPPQASHFQAELEALRRNLKKPTSKNGIHCVCNLTPCFIHIVFYINSVLAPPSLHHRKVNNLH